MDLGTIKKRLESNYYYKNFFFFRLKREQTELPCNSIAKQLSSEVKFDLSGIRPGADHILSSPKSCNIKLNFEKSFSMSSDPIILITFPLSLHHMKLHVQVQGSPCLFISQRCTINSRTLTWHTCIQEFLPTEIAGYPLFNSHNNFPTKSTCSIFWTLHIKFPKTLTFLIINTKSPVKTYKQNSRKPSFFKMCLVLTVALKGLNISTYLS